MFSDNRNEIMEKLRIGVSEERWGEPKRTLGWSGWSDSTAHKVLVLQVAAPGSILYIPYGSPNPVRLEVIP